MGSELCADELGGVRGIGRGHWPLRTLTRFDPMTVFSRNDGARDYNDVVKAREIVSAHGVDEAERTQRKLAFDDVYQEHADFVWRVVRRLGVPPDAAEDLVHEVFLVMHRRLHEYDGRASLKSWVYMLTRGVVSNHQRKFARARQRLAAVPAPIPAPDPEEQARYAEAASFVRTFLSTLDSDKREAFVLSDIEGMRGPEIAAMLGVNVNTIYARIAAARAAFRRMLDVQPREEAPDE